MRHDLNAATRTFEEALLRDEAVGFVVAATPLRFAGLVDSVATAFAEIGEVNCYHVFETRADARRQLRQIPPADRLGWIRKVRKVFCVAARGAGLGPRLDVRGHPFAMRGCIVDKSGAIVEWIHGGQLVWRQPLEISQRAQQPTASLKPRGRSRVRRILP